MAARMLGLIVAEKVLEHLPTNIQDRRALFRPAVVSIFQRSIY
jgi:hypothetical protein